MCDCVCMYTYKELRCFPFLLVFHNQKANEMEETYIVYFPIGEFSL